ncbi:MAG: PAS domain-containing protein, partial [Thermodesulfobacteriota bacterium]
MGENLIFKLVESQESFLTKWSEGMDKAGYLQYTTAKRDDCLESLRIFLEPLLAHLGSGRDHPPFGELIKNKGDWAGTLVQVARRHRFRGVTAEMFYGCFKTLVHAVEDLVREMDSTAEEKLAALELIRRCADAFETVFVGDWTAMNQKEALKKLDETNRRLTLEKNKYENILAATSDLVLVADERGTVVEANLAAMNYLGEDNIIGRPFWELLDLEGQTMGEVTRYYQVCETHEINPFDSSLVFNFLLVPLKSVSLATSGYMVLLTNVSCLVKQRESLERTVQERSAALSDTEKQFTSLFQAAGECILLVDINLLVVEANQRAARIFGYEPDEITTLYCRDLCDPQGRVTLDQVIRQL